MMMATQRFARSGQRTAARIIFLISAYPNVSAALTTSQTKFFPAPVAFDRRQTARQLSSYLPPDFSIEDDEGDTQKSGSDNVYIPPEISFGEDDDKTPSKTFTPPDLTFGDDEDDASRRRSKPRGPSRSNLESYGEEKPRRRRDSPTPRGPAQGASWMDRNNVYTNAAQDEDAGGRPRNDRFKNKNRGGESKTFREDFRGTRVFVQGLPPDASWQDLKDHFRQAGDVVFASVSTDRSTGESKGHGIVQYETTEMAQNAIDTMRNFPLDGFQLYVREDVQEKPGAQLGTSEPRVKGPTPPTKWKCANEENADFMSDDDIKAVRALIKARDQSRRRRQFDASDQMREELKHVYGVHIDDRLRLWWTTVDGKQLPQAIKDAKGEGRWGDPKAWRQIPTTPENDACVDPDLVNGLLAQRDLARKEKDFTTADTLLNEAREAPDGDLFLRIHDESRTWRIWTEAPPPRQVRHRQSPSEECIAIVEEHAPEKLDEVRLMLEKFPGREYNILKKIKQRYLE